MGALIEFVVNMLLELVIWLMQLFAKSLESMCSIKEDFIGSFSDTLLGEHGLYVSNNGTSLFSKGADPLLVLQSAGLCMLLLFAVWGLIKAMFGNLARAESPQKIVSDLIIYSLVISTYDLWVNAFLSAGFAPIYQEVENATGMELDLSSLLASSVAAIGAELLLDLVTGGATTPVFLAAGVLMSLLKLIFFFTLLGKLIELILEVVERFLLIFFVTIFGPLCLACGTSSSLSRVAMTWFRVWLNNYVLFILNMFFVKLSLVAIGNLAEKCANVITAVGSDRNSGEIFSVVGLWLLVYCTIRIGTKTDQIMRTLGFDVLQADGHILNPLTSGIIGSIIGNVAAGTIQKNSGKIVEGAKKGFFGAWGLTNRMGHVNIGGTKAGNKANASAKAKSKLAQAVSNSTAKADSRLTNAMLKHDMNGIAETSSVFGQYSMTNEAVEKTLNESADIAKERRERGVSNEKMLGTANFDKNSLAKINEYLHSKGMKGDVINAKIENGDLKFQVRDKDGNESYCKLQRFEGDGPAPANAVMVGNQTWVLSEQSAVKGAPNAGVTKDIVGEPPATMGDVAADTDDGYVTSKYSDESAVEQMATTDDATKDAETGYAVLKDGTGVVRLKVDDYDFDGKPSNFVAVDEDGNIIRDKDGNTMDFDITDFISKPNGQPAMFNLTGKSLAYMKKDGTTGYMIPDDEKPTDFDGLNLNSDGAPMTVSKMIGINVAQKTGKKVTSTYVPRNEKDAAADLVGVAVYGMEEDSSDNKYSAVDTKASRLVIGAGSKRKSVSGQGAEEVKTKAGYLVPEIGESGYTSKVERENGVSVTKMRVRTAGESSNMVCWLNGNKIDVRDAVSSGAVEQDSNGRVWATLEKGSYTRQTVATIRPDGSLSVKGQSGKYITLDSSFAKGSAWTEIDPDTDGTIEVMQNNNTYRASLDTFRPSATTGGVQRYSYNSMHDRFDPDDNGTFVANGTGPLTRDNLYEVSRSNLVAKTAVQDFAPRNTVGDIVTNSAGIVEFDTAVPTHTERNGATTVTSSYGQTFYNKKGDWASSAHGTGGADGLTEFRTEGTTGLAYTTAVAENMVDKEISRMSSDQAKVYFGSMFSGGKDSIYSMDMSRANAGLYSAQVKDDTGLIHEMLILSQNSFNIPRDKHGNLQLPNGVSAKEKILDSGLKVLEIDQNLSNTDIVARFIDNAKRDFKGLINKIQDMM